MKRIFSALTIVYIIGFFFTSCQKEIDWTAPVTVNDSIYLKKFIILDTTETSGADTSWVLEFNYNAQKRLSDYRITYYELGISGPGRIRGYKQLNYLYPGTDTFPSRIIENLTDLQIPANSYTDTMYYFYQNGSIIKDSSGNTNEYFVDEINKVSPTRTFLIQRDFDPLFGLTIDTVFIYTNWQNGNILAQKDSTWQPFMGGFWDVDDYVLGYDNKPNPFKRMVLPYNIPLSKDIFTVDLEDFGYPTNNNIIYLEQNGLGDNLSYQYRSDGLPVICRGDDGIKCYYQYTRL